MRKRLNFPEASVQLSNVKSRLIGVHVRSSELWTHSFKFSLSITSNRKWFLESERQSCHHSEPSPLTKMPGQSFSWFQSDPSCRIEKTKSSLLFITWFITFSKKRLANFRLFFMCDSKNSYWEVEGRSGKYNESLCFSSKKDKQVSYSFTSAIFSM